MHLFFKATKKLFYFSSQFVVYCLFCRSTGNIFLTKKRHFSTANYLPKNNDKIANPEYSNRCQPLTSRLLDSTMFTKNQKRIGKTMFLTILIQIFKVRILEYFFSQFFDRFLFDKYDRVFCSLTYADVRLFQIRLIILNLAKIRRITRNYTKKWNFSKDHIFEHEIFLTQFFNTTKTSQKIKFSSKILCHFFRFNLFIFAELCVYTYNKNIVSTGATRGQNCTRLSVNVKQGIKKNIKLILFPQRKTQF